MFVGGEGASNVTKLADMANSNNPRKFKDKIAIQEQKQKEDTVAFNNVMRDIIEVVPRGQSGMPHSTAQSMLIGQVHQPSFYRGGSLPNVNRMTDCPTVHHELMQPAVGAVQTEYPGYPASQQGACGLGPVRSSRGEHRRDRSPYRSEVDRPAYEHRRAPSPMLYTPPMSSLLPVPPPDNSWRRANSDSELHRNTHHSSAYSPHTQRRGIGGGVRELPGSGGSSPGDQRQWFPFDSKLGPVPVTVLPLQAAEQRVPGVHGALLPNGPQTALDSAGSLPDLTPAGFSAPPGGPCNPDELHHTPPFSSSPVSPVYVCPPSPGQQAPAHNIPACQPAQNHLTLPIIMPHNDIHHPFKCSPSLVHKYIPAGYGEPAQQQPMSPDSLADLSAYRNPQHSQRCPSPLMTGQPDYRSPSPLEPFPSAPSSPAEPSPTGSDPFYGGTQQMQQQFEHISMSMSPTVSAMPEMMRDASQQNNPLITVSYFQSPNNIEEYGVLHNTDDLLQGADEDTERLGELDLADLQMLTNPGDHVTDSTTEAYLRLESPSM